jgi:adenylate cyclase
MREQRKLAAVLAADVVGYSRLMGRDEAGTLARLKEHRAQRLEPALARNGGRLVKLTGDGALAEFPSAVDALRAAIEFQQAVGNANAEQPEEQHIVPDRPARGRSHHRWR